MIDFSVEAFVVNESIDVKKIKEKVIKIFEKLMELFDKAREKVLKIIEKFFGKNHEKMTALEKEIKSLEILIITILLKLKN